jgi:hypothetical protein
MVDIRKLLSSDWLESISISIFLYALVFSLLSFISISAHQEKRVCLIIESLPIETEPQDISESLKDISTFDQEVSILKAPSESMLSLPKMVEDTIVSIELPSTVDDSEIVSSKISSLLDNINEKISVGEESINHSTNIGGVLDRLTVEILNNAQSRNLNVVWLFDASISLSKQRAEIKNRFQKIIDEIRYDHSISANINHTIASFGSSCSILTKEPTNQLDHLIANIDKIILDESGIENVFAAIENICQAYKNHRNMIIVFTDEVGDDVNLLDKVSSEARKKATTIYVVGPPAPFGLDKIQFKYVDPDPKYDQNEKWVEISQGPETPFKMTLDLHTLDIDKVGIDSGFGPYGLSKLCMDTGGIYFAVHPNRNANTVSRKEISPLASYIAVFFDSSIMQKYRPDYRSLLLQNKEIQDNKVKLALIKACQIPIHIVYDQQTKFTAFTEGDFVEQLNEAQKFSARIEPKLEQIYIILKDVEQYSKNLSDKRWLASYSLAMGRILATKCRIESYNFMLAEAKSGLKKQDKKSNIWNIESDTNINLKSSQIVKTYESALKYLNFIADNFPNTPWAYVAKCELNTPMGYKWIESYQEPPKQQMDRNNNNNNQPRKDDVKKKIEYKPQRNTSKI